MGKLTVAHELAELTGYRLFHNHLTVDLVSAIFAFGSEPFVLLRERIWLSAFQAAAQHNASLIFTFAPERTVREQFITDTLEVVESAGGKVIFVELTCDPIEIEARIENESRKKYGKLSSLTQYQELQTAGVFAYPELPDSGLTFDTTKLQPKETARLIADKIRQV